PQASRPRSLWRPSARDRAAPKLGLPAAGATHIACLAMLLDRVLPRDLMRRHALGWCFTKQRDLPRQLPCRLLPRPPSMRSEGIDEACRDPTSVILETEVNGAPSHVGGTATR